jgi:hypothetical protein
MKHLPKIMHRKWNIELGYGTSRTYNGEDIKYKSFAAKDTAKG